MRHPTVSSFPFLADPVVGKTAITELNSGFGAHGRFAGEASVSTEDESGEVELENKVRRTANKVRSQQGHQNRMRIKNR